MSLLEDLRTVAANSLTGSDLPTHVEVQDLLGAVVKTLETAGFTVAKDLLSPPEAAVADAAITAAAPIADHETTKLLDYIKELEAKLEGKPTEPAPATEPASEPAPAEAATAPQPWSPSPSTPAAPPIEGAS